MSEKPKHAGLSEDTHFSGDDVGIVEAQAEDDKHPDVPEDGLANRWAQLIDVLVAQPPRKW